MMTVVLFDECCQVQEGIESRKRPGPPGPVASSHAFPMRIALQVAFPHCLPVVKHHTQKVERPSRFWQVWYSQAMRTILLQLIWRYRQKIYLKSSLYKLLLSREFSKKTRENNIAMFISGSFNWPNTRLWREAQRFVQKTRWPDGVVGTTISRKPWQPCVSGQACIRQLAWVMVQWCAARERYRHAKTSNLNIHFQDSCDIFKFSVGIILQSN